MFRPGSIHGRICKRFPGGPTPPPSPGISLYNFRIKDATVLTLSLVSRSGVPSSLALRPRYSVSCFRRAASDVWFPFLFKKLLLELLG